MCIIFECISVSLSIATTSCNAKYSDLNFRYSSYSIHFILMSSLRWHVTIHYNIVIIKHEINTNRLFIAESSLIESDVSKVLFNRNQSRHQMKLSHIISINIDPHPWRLHHMRFHGLMLRVTWCWSWSRSDWSNSSIQIQGSVRFFLAPLLVQDRLWLVGKRTNEAEARLSWIFHESIRNWCKHINIFDVFIGVVVVRYFVRGGQAIKTSSVSNRANINASTSDRVVRKPELAMGESNWSGRRYHWGTTLRNEPFATLTALLFLLLSVFFLLLLPSNDFSLSISLSLSLFFSLFF